MIESRGDESRMDIGVDRGIRTDEGQSDEWRGTIAVDMDDVLWYVPPFLILSATRPTFVIQTSQMGF